MTVLTKAARSFAQPLATEARPMGQSPSSPTGALNVAVAAFSAPTTTTSTGSTREAVMVSSSSSAKANALKWAGAFIAPFPFLKNDQRRLSRQGMVAAFVATLS